MAEKTKPKLYALIDWEDGYSRDVPISCIKAPRKENYDIGESVEALCPGFGNYKGTIAAIDEDREWLKKVLGEPRPVPEKPKNMTPVDGRNQSTHAIKPTGHKQKSKPKSEQKKPVKRKLSVEDDVDSEEAKRARQAENKKKKERAAAREETLAKASAELMGDQTPTKCSSPMSPRRSPRLLSSLSTLGLSPYSSARSPRKPLSSNLSNSALERLEKKMDSLSCQVKACVDAINRLGSCRGCAKKLFKSFDQIPVRTPISAPDKCLYTSPLTSTSQEGTSDVLSQDVASAGVTSLHSCQICEKTFMSEEFLAAHIASRHSENSEKESSETERNTNEPDLHYVGEAKFGVTIKSEDLARCNSSAKTASKLALNLLEFVVSKEDIMAGMSVYGNTQHKLKPIPANILQALKGHIFNQFPVEAEEKKRQWERIVESMNDKLKHIRKGKYAKQV